LLRLVVGSVRAADLGPFIPVDTQPAEAGKDRGQRLGLVPHLVGIIDAQNELPAMVPGEQPIEQGGSDAADVQVAGGTGSKACANHRFPSATSWPSTISKGNKGLRQKSRCPASAVTIILLIGRPGMSPNG